MHNFSISLDGLGTGDGITFDAPFGHARGSLCTEDRCFPAPFMRRVAGERLGIGPDEIAAGHCVALSRPHQLADLLDSRAPVT